MSLKLTSIKGRIGLTALVLLIFVIISGIIVANLSLPVSSNIRSDATISLTDNAPIYEANAAANNNITDESALPQVSEGSDTALSHITSEPEKNVGAISADYDKTWSTDTQVNIFEHNDTHVKSDGTGSAKHTIAPGTSNDYTFSLKNDKEYAIKYTLDISGANDSEYKIPVILQVIDSAGNLISGDWKTIGDFNSVSDSGSIYPYTDKQYIIRWKWDFENGTDSYDTSLGNKAVTEEIACHININVISEYDYDNPTPSSPNSSASDNPVRTGDSSNIQIYIIILGLCTSAFTIIFLLKKSYKDSGSL